MWVYRLRVHLPACACREDLRRPCWMKLSWTDSRVKMFKRFGDWLYPSSRCYWLLVAMIWNLVGVYRLYSKDCCSLEESARVLVHYLKNKKKKKKNRSSWKYFLRYVNYGNVFWWIHASAAKCMTSVLFWVIMYRILVIPYPRFGTTYRLLFQGSRNIPETSVSNYQYTLHNIQIRAQISFAN
jgi:hypothetical protein